MKISKLVVGPYAFVLSGLVVSCGAQDGSLRENDRQEAPAPRQSAELAAAPVTVVLPASADTSIRRSTQNKNYGIEVGLDVNRTLVRFDPAALSGAVGPTDVFVSARLELTLTNNTLRKRAPAKTVGAFRLKKDWTELGATWNCAIDTNTSNSAADCSGVTQWSMGPVTPNPWVSPATSNVGIAPTQTGVVSFDVTADVQGFLRGTFANNGWMLWSGSAAEFVDFASRESSTPPRLVLTVQRCSAALCDDGNVCTIDSCDMAANCLHAPATDGTTCSDGNTCTQADLCTAGTCASGPNVCGNVVINEVESSGGVPGDWIELYNTGSTAVDLSGFTVKDNDDTHVYTIPSATSIAAGGYLVIEESSLGFGLGGADSARLFISAASTTPVDSYTWSAHATTTYGRCTNGTGAFATTGTVTKGAANDCSSGPDAGGSDGGGVDAGVDGDAGSGLTYTPWPGANAVSSVDLADSFASNLSGLVYQPAGTTPAVLWAVQNGPSTLYRMEWNGSNWVFSSSDGWSAGKTLVYPSGVGGPDSEGVTLAESGTPFLYVATERDNTSNAVSRLSILRFDASASGGTLTATHEWNLTADLPAVGANLGLEGIAWVPDTYLQASSFFDESRGQAYDPLAYPDHGSGLFFVGIEANGNIYAYALNHANGTFQRVATIASGQAGVMDLSFDRETNKLWAYCDNTCGNRSTVLAVDTNAGPTFGRFRVRAAYERPSTMPDINNEGIAYAPESECTGGQKSFFWSDDSATGGHSIRRDSIPCGPLVGP